MDKAANNVVIICKERYVTLMLAELNRQAPNQNGVPQEVYLPLDWGNNQSILIDMATRIESLDSHGIGIGNFDCGIKSATYLATNKTFPVSLFPYMRATVKFHKPSLAFRFITSNANGGTAKLSSYIHYVLTFLQPFLKFQWAQVMTEAGISHFSFPILTQSSDIHVILDNWNAQWKMEDRFSTDFFLETYDVEAMYPSIPHPELKQALSFLFDIAMDHAYNHLQVDVRRHAGQNGRNNAVLRLELKKNGKITCILRPPTVEKGLGTKYMLIDRAVFNEMVDTLPPLALARRSISDVSSRGSSVAGRNR
jgi:hypothetical protein